jgi:hypothetical protein
MPGMPNGYTPRPEGITKGYGSVASRPNFSRNRW